MRETPTKSDAIEPITGTQEELTLLARQLRRTIDSSLEVSPDIHLRIAGEVARLRAEAGPDTHPRDIAWRRARERARRTATVGAIATAPAVIPLLGPAITAFGVVADWRYVAMQQRDMVLETAALMGVRLEDPSRQIRTLFVASAGAALTGTQVGELVGRTLGRRAAGRVLSRVVPGVGALLAGALNYLTTVLIARAAIGHFEGRQGTVVRGIIPLPSLVGLPDAGEALAAAARLTGRAGRAGRAALRLARAGLGIIGRRGPLAGRAQRVGIDSTWPA